MSIKELLNILKDNEEIKTDKSEWIKKNKYYSLSYPNKVKYVIDFDLINKMKKFNKSYQELTINQQKKLFIYKEPNNYIIYKAYDNENAYYGYTSKSLIWTIKVSLFNHFGGNKSFLDIFNKLNGIKVEILEFIKTKDRSIVNARKKYHEINHLPNNSRQDKLIGAIRKYFEKKKYIYSKIVYFYLIKENKKNSYVIASGKRIEDSIVLMIAMKNKEFAENFNISYKYSVNLVGIQKVKSKLELLVRLDFLKYHFNTINNTQNYNIPEIKKYIDKKKDITDTLTTKANKEINNKQKPKKEEKWKII